MLRNTYLINRDSQTLKQEILSQPNQSIIKVHFSTLLGNVYFINPQNITNSQLAQLLNFLDEQKNGRLPFAIVDYITGGPSLLASNNSEGIKKHLSFVWSLNRPRDYIKFTLTAIQNTLLKVENTINLQEFISTIARGVLIKGMFNLDEQPVELLKALEILSKANNGSDFSESVATMLIGVHYPRLFGFVLSALMYQARQQYITFIDTFILSQINTVLQDLHQCAMADKFTHVKNNKLTNVLSSSVLEILKLRKKINSYEEFKAYLSQLTADELKIILKDHYFRTLPAMLIGGDGLIDTISRAVCALALNPNLLEDLRKELIKKSIFNSKLFSEDTVIDELYHKFISDKKSNDLLNQIYLESLRMKSPFMDIEKSQFGSIKWRYTQEDIQLSISKNSPNPVTIPRNSIVAVLSDLHILDENYWPSAKTFNPNHFSETSSTELAKNISTFSFFSVGIRACPASSVSEFIIKTAISYLAMNFNFELKLDATNRVNDQTILSLSEYQPLSEETTLSNYHRYF